MTNDDLKQYVLSNPKLVTNRQSVTMPALSVLKYRKNVFFDNLWDDYLEHCRGTVVDANFNIVSYPFQKIYNYRIESRSPVFDDAEQVQAFRKVNGFMVAVSFYNGDVLVSTTGSLDSDYIGYAKEMMAKHMSLIDWRLALNTADTEGMTFMFECVHPLDPHIIPENTGMYILGYRENTIGSSIGHDPEMLKELGELFKCYVPESYICKVADVRQMAKDCKHEGYVFYHVDGRAAKIKGPYYLVQKALARKKDILALNKELVEEEYFGLVDHLLTIRDSFNQLDEQARLEYIRKFLSE